MEYKKVHHPLNDPSTGGVEQHPMLFDGGRLPHDAYHNQYADGMARASRQGFAQANPDQRIFLLTRSASAGTQRYRLDRRQHLQRGLDAQQHFLHAQPRPLG
ncbi:MAG: TIM-barrel domain-containing protein [Phycisphaerae bacterium]